MDSELDTYRTLPVGLYSMFAVQNPRRCCVCLFVCVLVNICEDRYGNHQIHADMAFKIILQKWDVWGNIDPGVNSFAIVIFALDVGLVTVVKTFVFDWTTAVSVEGGTERLWMLFLAIRPVGVSVYVYARCRSNVTSTSLVDHALEHFSTELSPLAMEGSGKLVNIQSSISGRCSGVSPS